jgi:hypothetical protein
MFDEDISGSFPHTLIYDDESLQKLQFAGDEPLSVEVVDCEIGGADQLSLGDTMDTTIISGKLPSL